MKILVTLFFLSVAGSLSAQSAQKEINEQVWKPFIASYADLNSEVFMSLQSHDVVRTLRDDGRVLGYDEYAKITASGDHNMKLNNYQKKLELRFTERWINNNLAFETGVYKGETIKPSGNNITYYGRFQVVLRKENGIWKILSDSDSSEGGTIGDKEFLSARPME